jgi:hypothetical protein
MNNTSLLIYLPYNATAINKKGDQVDLNLTTFLSEPLKLELYSCSEIFEPANRWVQNKIDRLLPIGYEIYPSKSDLKLESLNCLDNKKSELSLRVVEYLLSLHFDLFGLIEKEIAIKKEFKSFKNESIC